MGVFDEITQNTCCLYSHDECEFPPTTAKPAATFATPSQTKPAATFKTLPVVTAKLLAPAVKTKPTTPTTTISQGLKYWSEFLVKIEFISRLRTPYIICTNSSTYGQLF